MLPVVPNDDLQSDFEQFTEPSKTFGIKKDGERVFGTIDEIEALTQSIYLMLSIERYEFEIYPWSVGFETLDLFGKPVEYVASEVPRRITECIMEDDRILGTSDFVTTAKKGSVSVRYIANTIYGDINLEREVNF